MRVVGDRPEDPPLDREAVEHGRGRGPRAPPPGRSSPRLPRGRPGPRRRLRRPNRTRPGGPFREAFTFSTLGARTGNVQPAWSLVPVGDDGLQRLRLGSPEPCRGRPPDRTAHTFRGLPRAPGCRSRRPRRRAASPLTRKKLRRLEITAGAPKYTRRGKGIWSTNDLMRTAELELAQQAETSYKRMVQDQQAGGPAKKAGASVTLARA